MIDRYIDSLVAYGSDRGLITQADLHYVRNALLERLHLDTRAFSGRQKKYTFTPENAEDILRREVGSEFAAVLEHAGVFKRTQCGKDAFLRFVRTL